MRSDNFKKIVIFLSIEFLLVAFIGGILSLIDAESGSTEVIVMSIIFMWLPALAVFITRKITYDKSPLLLKPKFKKNWRMYLASAYIPSIMIILGTVLYFIVFPRHLDLTLGYVKSIADAYGQQVSLPTLSIPALILIAIGLALFAPFVFKIPTCTRCIEVLGISGTELCILGIWDFEKPNLKSSQLFPMVPKGD